MTSCVRILLVDDSPDFLAAAADFLVARPGLQVVGSAASGAEALELVARLPVDLVILDLNMCGMNGFETARRLKVGPNPPKIVIATLQEAPECRHLALAVGADGFVAKSEFTTALLPLIASLFPATPAPPSVSDT